MFLLLIGPLRLVRNTTTVPTLPSAWSLFSLLVNQPHARARGFAKASGPSSSPWSSAVVVVSSTLQSRAGSDDCSVLEPPEPSRPPTLFADKPAFIARAS